ncbi:MAG: STAS-like domain-containing protein [Cyanobacteria bacterium]|nr:STAS-like domain-containing protein [Cyanobacteriota bacterium]
MSTVLQMKDLIGDACLTSDDGLLIFDLLKQNLLVGNRVEVDFEGVEVVATPFFNAAFGRLVEQFSVLVKESVHPVHLDDDGLELFDRVLDNAYRYYSDPQYRAAITSVLEQESSD